MSIDTITTYEFLIDVDHARTTDYFLSQQVHAVRSDNNLSRDEQIEGVRVLSDIRDHVRGEGVRLFGVTNKNAPECSSCRINSVFGGPDHAPSDMCRTIRRGGTPRPHCTCNACF